jgi:hypothetical protein
MNPPLDSYEEFTSGWWLYKIQDYQNIHVTTCELTAAGKYVTVRVGTIIFDVLAFKNVEGPHVVP